MARYNNDLPFNLNDRFTDEELDMGLDRVVEKWRGTTCSREVRKSSSHRKFVRRRFVRDEELAVWNEFAHRAAEDRAVTIKSVLRDLHSEIDSINAEGIGSVFIRKPTYRFFRRMVDRACEELA
ncbi:hypothetical protein [Sinorhizobium meliloti]|uniref:hypothetical protein n=1 Tax=Rhizobium meliloti TaxID=382 RepID=UPI000FD6EB68|nr:hypothetical protein [Sinorhizobium meliloti]MDW9930487.1 hypothetical protein [Sinorhizobium meliloti]MDX0964750.1 hypothetical protein [Sinorhizobium medicae]RVI46895.1 hypothetical protein CN195_22955 [Sinorhizobium meliloti]